MFAVFGVYTLVKEKDTEESIELIAEIFEEELVNDTIPQLVSALEMKSALYETLAEVHDYLLTGDLADKAEFEEARELFEEVETKYEEAALASGGDYELDGDEAAERANELEIIEVREGFEDEMDIKIEELIVLFEGNGSEKEILEKKEELEDIADVLAGILDKSVALESAEVEEEEEELEALIENVNENIRSVLVIFIAFLILALPMAILIAVYIARAISESVNKARDAAVEIAHGNMDIVIESHGEDEISELMRALDKMRSDLKISFSNLEAEKKSLEEKVQTRTQDLKKTTAGLTTEVSETSEALKQRVKELEELNRVMVGREIKMAELKNKIVELEQIIEKSQR